MSGRPTELSDCGCCEGVSSRTPVSVTNRPGLSALAYRVGTHGTFKESMLASLSREPALAALTTRDDDDPTVALIDAWASVLHVLTFYQERIAGEGFLRTATERRSVLELARRIGYTLRPGVAAMTHLAFTLEDTQGTVTRTAIAAGNKAQSIPRQGELPQIFETVLDLDASSAFNALRPRLREPQDTSKGAERLYLAGTDTQLAKGDAILLVGDARDRHPHSERWDFRIVQAVAPDPAAGHTVVTWVAGLGHEQLVDERVDGQKTGRKVLRTVHPADNPRVYAFRQRAALFGYNAPDWRAMPKEIRAAFDPQGTSKGDWPGFETKEDQRIYLDAVYPRIVEDSWLVLTKPGYVELYRAERVQADSRTDFTLTAKTTRLDLDTGWHLDWFPRRETVVFASSEELELAEVPIVRPLFGNSIHLAAPADGLEEGRTLIVTGRRLAAVVVADRTRIKRVGRGEVVDAPPPLILIATDGTSWPLADGDALAVLGVPLSDGVHETWFLRHGNGRSGYVVVVRGDLVPDEEPVASGRALAPDASSVSEVVTLDRLETGGAHAILHLTRELQHVYRRASVTINGNVAPATHGETKTEALGSGDASSASQRFTLSQVPLTHVSASAPSGTASTLEVRVNGILWKEVPTLYGAACDAEVYVTRLADDGTVTVQFGDGLVGARLPTGTDNVEARYRVGIGLKGLVEARQISLLMSQPLGVKSVINPLAPAGADDPEAIEDARSNAPLTVLTLDRIVSLVDFEDFARAFAGVGKVQARLLWNGERQMVHLTVAAPEGDPLGATLRRNLIDGIDGARHADQEVQVDSFVPRTFGVDAAIQVDRRYLREDVEEAVRTTLVAEYSFGERAFAQPVTAGEVLASIQRVGGVIAVDLDALDGRDPFAHPTVAALPAHRDPATRRVVPAELLTIDPERIALKELTA